MPIRPALAAVLVAAPALAADVGGGSFSGAPTRPYPPRALVGGCAPPGYVTRAPTNAPDDPTYVGSAFGLGRPSYHGTTPPPGVDDPYGRRVRACP